MGMYRQNRLEAATTLPYQTRGDGVWKDRALDAIAEDVKAAVCDATLRWEQPTKKARTHGASEHTMSGKISLDDAIEKLQIHKEADELASKILAAAITLRDSKGRDRKAALRRMAGE